MRNIRLSIIIATLAIALAPACKPKTTVSTSLEAAQGASDAVTSDQIHNISELHKILPPFRCDLLEKIVGGRQQTYTCGLEELDCASNDPRPECRVDGRRTSCRPGTHYSVWKTAPGATYRGKVAERYEFKPLVYVVGLEFIDKVRGSRPYWVNYRVDPIPERQNNGLGPAGYMCVPDKIVAQTMPRDRAGEATTAAIQAQVAQAEYQHLVMIVSNIPFGVGAAIQVDMCRAGEMSCFEAAFSVAMAATDVAIPVGMAFQGAARAGQLGAQLGSVLNNAARVGRQVAIVGNVIGGGIRGSQALYEGANGNGWKAAFLGAEAVLRLGTAGMLRLESVASKIDDFGNAATAGAAASPCLSLAGAGCTLQAARETATEAIGELRNMEDERLVEAVYDAWSTYLKNHARAAEFSKGQAFAAIDRIITERVTNALQAGGSVSQMTTAQKLMSMAAESADELATALTQNNQAVLAKYLFVK